MIQTKDLSYGYFKHRMVLNHVTLELPAGHVYGLFGKNGVGKSTLLKLLCGALRGNGLCQVCGNDASSRSVELLQNICFVPEAWAVSPMTIHQLAAVTRPFYPSFSEEIFLRALQELEVPVEMRINNMSLGQQKKALISLSMACNTPVLLFDEPTNGMDIPSKAAMRRLIASIASPDRLVIISTHQVDDLENLIDAAIIMSNEGILLNATLEEIGKKLAFGPREEGCEPLYAEQTLRGEWCVYPNESGEEGPVDMKLLFSAVVKNPTSFETLFKKS